MSDTEWVPAQFTIWSEDARAKWPCNPAGYVYMAQALDLIGRLLFGNDWAIDDMNTKLRLGMIAREFQPKPPRSIAAADFASRSPVPSVAEQRAAFDKLRADDRRHNELVAPAFARRDKLLRIVTSAADNGELETFYHSMTTFELHPIPRYEWSVSSNAHRIIKLSVIGPIDWMKEADRKSSSNVFVADNSLRAVDWRKVEYRPEPMPLGDVATTPSVSSQHPVRSPIMHCWTEEEMNGAIQQWARSAGSRDRDRAWREHFKARGVEHGWDNRSFRDQWAKALGSIGKPGPRPYSAQ